MGEEEKKAEEKTEVEEKKEEEAAKKAEEEGEDGKKPADEEKKKEETKEAEQPPPPPPPPPPPEEIILRVFMHCEGCARKVKKCLKGFEGVEDVQTDCKTHNVTVKGKKADPLKVLERLQRKSHRKVELLTPIPKPPPPEDDKKPEETPQPEQEKKEEVVITTVVLKVHMHCEACAQEIQKRILRMKGVESADPDLKGSQVTVKGVFDPPKLVEYVYKRTGKHAFVVKTEVVAPAEKKKEGEAEIENKGKEEKTEDQNKTECTEEKTEEKKGGGEEEKKEEEKKKDEEAKPVEAAAGGTGAEEEAQKVEVIELKRNELYYYPPKYNMEYVYPPQIFSDENPNACSIM